MRLTLRALTPRPLRRALWSIDQLVQTQMQRAFERRYDIDTSGHEYLEELGVQGKGRAFYEGIAWWPLRRALASLRPGPDDVFVDLGCGKGQALVVAGQFPMREVIGVELAEQLADDAQRNIERAKARLTAAAFTVLAADALAWDVPDELSIVFMFCPFAGEIFERAMQRIFDSHDRNPRPLHLMYAYPWEHNALLATGRVEVVDVRCAQFPVLPWWPWSAWVMPIYRVLPEGAIPSRPRPRGGPLRRAAIRRWSEPTDQRFALYRPDTGLDFEF
jgi:SAM-dependent methyltransferase